MNTAGVPMSARPTPWTNIDARSLIAGLISGVITGLFAITLAFSVAALIFSGKLESQVAVGIGLALFSSIVIGLFISLRSEYRGMVGSIQEVPGVILALIVAGIVAGFPAAATAPDIMPTALAAIALGSLACGGVFWLLGRLRLGGLVRFVPYPVIGGFLAATGWILVVGGLEVSSGLSAQGHDLQTWFAGESPGHWLPGLGAGVLLFVASLRCRHFLVLPGLLIAIALSFFLFLWVNGISIAEATARSWLLHAPEGELAYLMSPADWSAVQWSLLWEQLPGFLVLTILCVLSLLLNVSGIELATNRTVDVDRELRTTGAAHLLGGIGGAPPGYHLLGMSVLSHRLGGTTRLTGICAALVVALPLLMGGWMVTLFPKLLLGGLLVFLGLDFLYSWLWQTRRSLPLSDYLTILLILAASIAFGFLEGVAVGMVVALILFVERHIRISVIKGELSGTTYHSRVQRSPRARQILSEQGDDIVILQLQGFIFFGTGQQLLDYWLDRTHGPGGTAPRYTILDCQLVTGLDSSAQLSLKRLTQLVKQRQGRFVVAALSPVVARTLSDLDPDHSVRRFITLDQAMEWCEDDLLRANNCHEPDHESGLTAQFRLHIDDEETMRRFRNYLVPLSFAAGQTLFRQGEPADSMLFLKSGRVTMLTETAEGNAIRVRTLGPGSVVGEMSLHSGQPRAVTVVAETDAVIHSLDRESLQRMEHETPELIPVLHRMMIALMAGRLEDTMALVRALAR